MRITKLYVLAIALLVSFGSARAQFFEDARYRAEAGVTLSRVSNWGVGSDLLGFRVSGLVELPVKYAPFSLVSGLTLTNKGERSSFYGTEGETIRTSLLYLQLPLEATFSVIFNKDNRFVIGTGPFVAYGLTGTSSRLSTLFKSTGEHGAPFRRFEVGWGGNLSYVYDRYSLKFGLEYSLTDVMNRSSVLDGSLAGTAAHGLVYFVAGYRF